MKENNLNTDQILRDKVAECTEAVRLLGIAIANSANALNDLITLINAKKHE